MSAQPRYEVWLHSLSGTVAEPAEHALSRVFGIPLESARELVSSLPRVVKRDADAGLATRIVAALESIGGRAQSRPMDGNGPAPAPAYARAGTSEPPSSAATLKLGTQDLQALLPSAWSRPIAAPVAVPVAAEPTFAARPDSTRPDALELSSDAPIEPLHPLEVRRRVRERVSLRAPELFGAAGAPPAPSARPAPAIELPAAAPAFEHAVAVEPGGGWQHPLQLPLSGPPPRPALPMRPPTERARDPQRRNSPPAVRARAQALPSLLHPLKLALSIWERAEQSSWSAALQGHPVAGFLLVLGGTSGLFLLLVSAL